MTSLRASLAGARAAAHGARCSAVADRPQRGAAQRSAARRSAEQQDAVSDRRYGVTGTHNTSTATGEQSFCLSLSLALSLSLSLSFSKGLTQTENRRRFLFLSSSSSGFFRPRPVRPSLPLPPLPPPLPPPTPPSLHVPSTQETLNGNACLRRIAVLQAASGGGYVSASSVTLALKGRHGFSKAPTEKRSNRIIFKAQIRML